jgi:hypothetical protein
MRWVWRFTRIIAILPFTLVIDVLLFYPNANARPFIGPYPSWMIASIVLFQLGGEASLIWVAYRRGLNKRKLAWQTDHPEGLITRIETTASSFSDADEVIVGPDERYLGGFYSLRLSTGYGRGVRLGFGVYATNKRLFGIAQYKPSFTKTVPLIPSNLSREMNNLIIKEILQTKSFEIPADEILKIELKIPAGLFRGGHLQIHRIDGQLLTINVGRKQPGEQLRNVLEAFDPQILAVM